MIGASFVVELVGLRGVGKSTLAGEIVRILRESGTACNRLEPVGLSRKVGLRLQSFGRLLVGYAFVARRGPVSWTELGRCARAYTLVSRRLAECRLGAGVHVLDEGVFQLGARIHLSTRAQDLAAICHGLLRWVALPDLVVVVEASRKTVETRRRLRGHSRDTLYREVSPAAARGLDDLKMLLQGLSRTTPSLGYVEATNDEDTPPREAAAPVAALILERYRAARGADD